ncbi:MAG TPA: PilZ domain-containing protein [Steroidobacteraceae bacterium]|nr:PilZ domain-containing protein [Steroidobacteraceae bacterium]
MSDTIRMMALSGLAYEDFAPLGWRALSALPDKEELLRLNAENAQVLQADSSLEEHRRVEPRDESEPLFQELQRLEFKLDVVLRVMSNLLERQDAMPERRKFRIYAQGLEWAETAQAPKPGALGVVSLYVNRSLPFPIQLPAEVSVVTPGTGETNVRIAFRGLSSHVGDLLEKLIFRHHRRLVAEARQHR